MRIEHFRGQTYWKVMPQKIDVIDRKIAFLLCKNCRFSNTAIAKALRSKREVVSYRIKKMQEKEFLNGFVARINPRKLGFTLNFVYFKLKTPTKEKEMIEEFMEKKEITRLKNVGGKFDILTEFSTKNIEEFDSTLKDILNKYGHMIQDYSLLNYVDEDFTDVDILLEEDKKELERLREVKESKGSSFQKEFDIQNKIRGKNHKIINLEEIDFKILSLLRLNARINLKEVATKTKTNFPLVQRRIKRMVEEGVITAFTAFISLAHLGYQMYPVLLHLRTVDEGKLRTFIQLHPNLLWSYKLIGNWNYQINVFAKNNAHFHDVLNDFREAFSENIVSFETNMVFNYFKMEQRIE